MDGTINMVVDKTDTSAVQELPPPKDPLSKDKSTDEDGEQSKLQPGRGGGRGCLLIEGLHSPATNRTGVVFTEHFIRG